MNEGMIRRVEMGRDAHPSPFHALTLLLLAHRIHLRQLSSQPPPAQSTLYTPSPASTPPPSQLPSERHLLRATSER